VSLTGPVTLALAVLLAVLMPAVAVLAWNRVGRRPGRAAAVARSAWRATLMAGSQLTAVVLVAVLANDAGNFYSSWLELLGEHHSLHTSAIGPGGQDSAVAQKLAAAGARGHGIVVPLLVPGTASGIGAFKALVYLPEQYGQPQYAHRSFPVVELIAGSPGTPKTWTASLNVAGVLDREIAAGRSLPFIAVMPSQDVAGNRDTQCVNVVHGPAVETYLTTDVRAAVARAFRANMARDAWAVMGYSSGGFCATNLAMRHPDLYDAAASVAGYARPAHDHQTGDLFGRDAARRDQNTPIWRALHLPSPDVSLLLMSSSEDPSTRRDATALAAAARGPLSVTLVSLKHGGHNFEMWRAEEPVAFDWLSSHLTAPLAPPPVIDNTAPVVAGR
jgi:S-formylglutathione hydrolase FrmB